MCRTVSQLTLRAACSLLPIIFLLAPNSLFAQHFLNDRQGQWINGTGATIRFRANSGEIRNSNATLTNLRNFGTIELYGSTNRFTGDVPLGAQISSRIEGLVRYTSTNVSLPQTLHARWYSNLAINGVATKLIPDGIYIGGDSDSTGRFTAEGGTRFYNGTLTFDNVRIQRITGNEAYQNIRLQRGEQPKLIERGTVVTTRGEFRQDPSNDAGLQIWGTLSVGTNADFPPTLQRRGNIEVGTTSTINPSIRAAFNVGNGQTRFGVREVRVVAGILTTRFNTAEVLVQTGATLRLADISAVQANTFGQLSLTTASQTLRISGTLRNDRAECDNTRFHPQSLIVFEARRDEVSEQVQSFPQEIMRTLPNAPYGNLQCNFSDKIIAPSPSLNAANISLAGDFRMNGGMLNVARNTANPDSSGALVVLNPDARLEYSALAEVRGSVRRMLRGGTGNFVFNNAAIRFLATSRTFPDTMTFTVLQGSPPRVYEAASDVRRHIVWTYSQHNDRTWQGNLQLSYRASEIISPFQPISEQYLSFFAATHSPTNPDTTRRIATTLLLRDAASEQGFGIVEQYALTNAANSLFNVQSGENIILRGKQEIVRSLRDGRWSNPLTWNVLRQPVPNDSVEVNHTVHAGFRRNAIDGTATLGQIREEASIGGSVGRSGEPLARTITIASRPNAALLLGSVDISPLSPEAFPDERIPDGKQWSAGSVILQESLQNFDSTSRTAAFTNLLQTRTNAEQPYRGLVVFAPSRGADSLTFRLQSLRNAATVVNGARLETAQILESTGRIENSGTIIQYGATASISQAAIGGWVRFSGDSAAQGTTAQNVPPLTYSRLALEGRSPKSSNNAASMTIQDSLMVESQAAISLSQNSEIQIWGGMLMNGNIAAPRQSSLLRLNGGQKQFIQGFGTMDGLAVENLRGVEVVQSVDAGRGLVVRSRLNLTQGVLAVQPRANLLLEDDALISRHSASSITAEPLRTGRIRLRTLGNSIMIASGELPTDSLVLRTMEILNTGGYILTKPSYILDSLTVASKLFAETINGTYFVALQNPNTHVNPRFVEDSAEVVGSMRRNISLDTTTRLFNNRYSSLTILNANVLQPTLGSTMNADVTATMRTIPSTFPEPNADTSKVRRTLSLEILTNNLPQTSPIIGRVGYAWRTNAQANSALDETNNLDNSRIVLQNWLPAPSGGGWRTVGIPFRPTIRSRWNRSSESGLWQFGAMDSVGFVLFNTSSNLASRNVVASRFFALGIDSAISVLPSAFLSAKVFLEGAYQPPYLLGSLFTEGKMRTLLRSQNLLPPSFDSTSTAQFGNLFNTRIQTNSQNITDWVLLEIRPVRFADSTLWIPALLRNDGQVIGMDARTPVRIELPSDNEDFQVHIHHRNHTSLSFAETIKILPESRITLDFSVERNLANIGKSARIVDISLSGSPIFAMRSGDAFGNDGIINRFDYDNSPEASWNRIFGQGYLRQDTDLDGIVTTKDLNRIWNNRGSNSATRKP